ncbi:hypothetical protein SAMN05421544_12024 [Riemerella columbipharyngis]|uniref:Uncharacterized protein n=1 Tax=Riemerella columbipharyngis TaxID=1071918 RepID=A0A1G7F8A7_9FLAO|nr:hypothetical protein SAMN05421544_12024 [Riemerella columbipharyngis]
MNAKLNGKQMMRLFFAYYTINLLGAKWIEWVIRRMKKIIISVSGYIKNGNHINIIFFSF